MYLRADRRNGYLLSAYGDRQHAVMIMVFLNSLNTEVSYGNILETICTYFKLFADVEYIRSVLMTDQVTNELKVS